MRHYQFTEFQSFKHNGIQFLALVNNSQTNIYSQGDGRLHNWGSFYTVDSFLKRLKDEYGGLGPLKPLD